MSGFITPPVRVQQAVKSNPDQRKRRDLFAHIKGLFQDDEAYGVSLLAGALRFIDYSELLSFEPETIRLELQDSLKLNAIDDEIFGRFMAATSILTTDLFYRDVVSFIEVCNVLSGTPAQPGIFDPADTYEMCWAVAESKFIDAVESTEDVYEFSAEIRGYMGYQLQRDGFISAPKILSMAVFPKDLSATEITDDQDIVQAIVERDISLQADIDEMLGENVTRMREQLEPIVGPLEQLN